MHKAYFSTALLAPASGNCLLYAEKQGTRASIDKSHASHSSTRVGRGSVLPRLKKKKRVGKNKNKKTRSARHPITDPYYNTVRAFWQVVIQHATKWGSGRQQSTTAEVPPSVSPCATILRNDNYKQTKNAPHLKETCPSQKVPGRSRRRA